MQKNNDNLFKDTIYGMSFALVIVLIIWSFIARPFVVRGESMYPTFDGDGEYIIVERVSYKFKEPKRGDVIVFNSPSSQKIKKTSVIKRVIALPGEKIVLDSGEVYIENDIDNFKLDEPYVTKNRLDNKTLILGKEEYFVMGDNRRDSYDSRQWGALDKEDIVGKVFFQALPVNELALYPGKIK